MDEQNGTSQSAPPPKPPTRRSTGTGLLLGLTVAGVGLFAASAGIVYYLVSQSDRGEVHEGSFLEVDLAGPLPDAPIQGRLFLDPADVPPTVADIAGAIRHAADDERIEGLYLDLSVPQAGWASYQEIRSAIDTFEAAGKPCVAFAGQAMLNGDYYLASACDTIVLDPAGAMLVTGLATQITYYKGTLDKLGITPEYEHVGDFKSAIEVFERTGPSDEAAEAYETLLDSTWSQMLSGIAEGRGVDVTTAETWIDEPDMTPEGALARGMVDAVAYEDAVRATLSEAGTDGWADGLDFLPEEPPDDDDTTSLSEYLKTVRADRKAGAGPAVALVFAEGNIVPGQSEPGLFGGDDSLTDGEFSDWMEAVRDDDRVEAVVVRVNSRGGSGLASAHMWREVERTKVAGKPVVVSFGDYAASGGYYMSAGADHIIAQPGTITGSIGVFGGKFDLSGAYDKLGLTQHSFKRGELADLLSVTQPFSDEGRKVFKGYLSSFYEQFLGVVSEGRDMSRDEVHAVAQGRVWTGEQALGHGLVDSLGGLPEAVDKAAELAELEGDFHLRRWPRQKDFFEMLMEDLGSAQATVVSPTLQAVDALAPEVRDELGTLWRIQQDGGVAALLPGMPTVR